MSSTSSSTSKSGPGSNSGTGQALYRKAKQLIPGAAQLMGKRAEMYLPEQWPAYYSKASGCEIWDLDNNKYLDFTMVGIGTSVLGYADPDVEAAVIAAVKAGTMTTLNCPEDVQLAELLLELHPWAQMVSYARTGGEMMVKAVRIARAATGREKVAFCGYHGWHDWYLAVNLSERDGLNGHLLPGLDPTGVPSGLGGTMLPFQYNNLAQLEAIVAQHGNELAAICMEPVRGAGPADGFLQGVRDLATKCGAVLLFDEITCGFRMNTGGMHQIYGVDPDLVTYAKTMSNGVPMAAVVGRRDVMDALQKTFVSSAYWTEKVGPAAAIATVTKHRKLNVGKTLTEIGQHVQAGWKRAAQAANLEIGVSGIPPLSSFNFVSDQAAPMTTLFIQDMLDAGFLASDRFYPTIKHAPEHLAAYLSAVEKSFANVADALKKGDITSRLRGPVKHTGFTRLT